MRRSEIVEKSSLRMVEEEWSKWHRIEAETEERKRVFLESLPTLGLTEAQYREMEGMDHFLEIVGVALQRGINYWKAEIIYYDARREARDAALREQYQDLWHGDGTGVYNYNRDPSFDNDITLKHKLGGHLPKRG